MAEPAAETPAPGTISMVLMADPVSLSVVRQRFRVWLADLAWPDEEVDDIVLAVNEAVSNAVEHADAPGFASEVRVAARQFSESDGGRRIVVGVSDNRRWCPPGVQRGLGMLMIRTCMDDVRFESDHEVTTTLMTSVRVAPHRRG
ncbi:ATP-binding protein [Pseudonocardia lacus]|uniref:ATP-binding protein n=1 Tax=Pseudonocardia lacus TaxID=2835865 RepID=UPI001BDBD347|nr:ATP-binding protein [Pseudonocardia lacus]